MMNDNDENVFVGAEEIDGEIWRRREIMLALLYKAMVFR